MRAVSTNLTHSDITPHLEKLVDRLFQLVPAGVGAHGHLRLTRKQFDEIAVDGAQWCLRNGYAWNEDLERTEEFGRIKGADIKAVSERAIERGFNQIGTLGSGNHFLEIQIARQDNIFDSKTAAAFGINTADQVIVMFHCGSRGFGHQIATDYLQLFLKVMGPKYHITMPDRELACAPFNTPEGQLYFSAMKCAVNMSFANRQVILYQIRKAFSDVFGRSAEDLGMHQIYDITHNTAKIETHKVNGRTRRLLLHRKGSTRAFGPHAEGLPDIYKNTGQPIIIGGSMETGSYLLAGVSAGDQTFFSTTHGSGRTMSRSKARHDFYGKELQQQMALRGIVTRTASFSGFAEEAGAAYKNIDDVVESAEKAGTCRRIVRLVPVGNVKG
jgi:tRNA-splicing ligase RtcB